MSYFLGPDYSMWADIPFIIGIIGGVIGLIFWVYQFKLYRFFSQFEGDFEKHFGKGFLILFGAGILSLSFRAIGQIFRIYLRKRYGSSDYAATGIPLSMLYENITGLLLGIASLYAIYLLFKGTRYYKS